MPRTNIAPRERALELLNEALNTGIRGRNREAVANAITVLEADGKGDLTDLHYKNLPVGQTLRDPQRRGLWMRRNKSGSLWIFNYVSPASRKETQKTIGQYPRMGLGEARALWEEYRAEVKAGRDPFLEQEQEASSRITVKKLCKKFIDEYAKVKKRSWKEDQRQFDFDLVRLYGDRNAATITRDDIEAMLDEVVERGSPRSAQKLLAAVRKLYNHAIKYRWVPGLEVNPCQHAEVEHSARETDYLTEKQIRSFLRKLPESGMNETIQDILLLQFLTVARVGEVAGLKWSEIDFRHDIWNLPKERSKNGSPHRVLLSQQAKALLKRRQKESSSDYVFPAARSEGRQPVPGTLVNRALAENREFLKVSSQFTTHGLRHTAITQLASMGCGKELRDRISNHKEKSVDSLYQHYEHDAEAREWWQAWADRMDALKGAGDE